MLSNLKAQCYSYIIVETEAVQYLVVCQLS